MTTSAHGNRHVYSGATHNAAAPCYGCGAHKTSAPKRKPVAWLYCSADEFIRLLAQHEAGEINLLDMAGDLPDEPDEVAEIAEEVAPTPQPQKLGNGGAINRVLALLRTARHPLTPRRISELTGLELRSVRGALSARKGMMTREMTEDGYAWRLISYGGK